MLHHHWGFLFLPEGGSTALINHYFILWFLVGMGIMFSMGQEIAISFLMVRVKPIPGTIYRYFINTICRNLPSVWKF